MPLQLSLINTRYCACPYARYEHRRSAEGGFVCPLRDNINTVSEPQTKRHVPMSFPCKVELAQGKIIPSVKSLIRVRPFNPRNLSRMAHERCEYQATSKGPVPNANWVARAEVTICMQMQRPRISSTGLSVQDGAAFSASALAFSWAAFNSSSFASSGRCGSTLSRMARAWSCSSQSRNTSAWVRAISPR